MESTHLILDIDDTLLRTFERRETSFYLFETLLSKCISQQKEYETNNLSFDQIQYFFVAKLDCVIVLRPGVREFLDYASRRFGYISIWSAGIASYVKFIKDLLFHDTRINTPPSKSPLHVYHRDHCDFIGSLVGEVIARKPLIKIPSNSAQFTILMDNTSHSAVSEDEFNLFPVPTFTPRLDEKQITRYITGLETDVYFINLENLSSNFKSVIAKLEHQTMQSKIARLVNRTTEQLSISSTLVSQSRRTVGII